jgi:hypothetical protein
LNQHQKKWDVGCALQTIYLPSQFFCHPHRFFHQGYNTTSSLPQDKEQYEVTIGDFLTYTCMDFITMMTSLLGG